MACFKVEKKNLVHLIKMFKRYGLETMLACGNGGRIVNNASICGIGGGTAKAGHCGHYGATKVI